MAQFKIRIIETLEKVVTVSATDRKNALEIVEDKYSNAKDGYVLDADNFTNVDFKVLKDD